MDSVGMDCHRYMCNFLLYRAILTMLNWFINNTEYIVFCMNILNFLAFAWKHEIGKAIYWLGATILVIGLIKTKG